MVLDPLHLEGRPASERQRMAERLAERLDPVMTGLGVLLVLIVLGETLSPDGSALGSLFFWAGWFVWALFAGEFALRLAISPARGAFLRRHWWEVIFLVVPFLRFVRLLRAFRAGRASRIVASAIRGGRSATRTLAGRLGWLLMIHLIVVLAVSQLLFEYATHPTYAAALHAAALASVSGESLGRPGAFAAVMDVLLAVYAVVVFATAAGAIGAFLLERKSEDEAAERRTGE